MTTTTTGGAVPSQRCRHPRPAAPLPPAWCCENCTQVNAGRRRRCSDCGTTRE